MSGMRKTKEEAPLSWKLTVAGLSEDDKIGILIDQKNGHLLPEYINTMPEVWEKQKPHVIKWLIRNRQRDGESSAVFILAGLVSKTDPVAFNALTQTEKAALVNASSDYKSARSVLAGYKLLAATGSALSFTPKADVINVSKAAVNFSSGDVEFSPWPREKVEAHHIMDASLAAVVNSHLTAMRMLLWLETLENVYGKAYSNKIRAALKKEYSHMWHLIEEVFGFIATAKKEALLPTATLGWNSIMAGKLAHYLPSVINQSEEVNKQFHELFLEIYNAEYVFWGAQTRFFIRYFANNVAERRSDFELSEDDNDRYMALGSIKAGDLEAKSMYEDWIGLVS